MPLSHTVCYYRTKILAWVELPCQPTILEIEKELAAAAWPVAAEVKSGCMFLAGRLRDESLGIRVVFAANWYRAGSESRAEAEVNQVRKRSRILE